MGGSIDHLQMYRTPRIDGAMVGPPGSTTFRLFDCFSLVLVDTDRHTATVRTNKLTGRPRSSGLPVSTRAYSYTCCEAGPYRSCLPFDLVEHAPLAVFKHA